MNRVRVITSGAFLLFATYCAIWNPELPFSMPQYVYIVATAFFAVFPIKDMISATTRNSYKGRQFKKYYVANAGVNEEEFKKMKRRYDLGALKAIIFWLSFMGVFAALYFTKVIGREWIFFLFAMSDFCVFIAVFGWCPFHKIFVKSPCCNECRIYNWDSFFQYSFLIFIPNVYTIILFVLGAASLIEWEIMYALHPKRFYKMTNCALSCDKCDMEACKKHHKQTFSKKLKPQYAKELQEKSELK